MTKRSGSSLARPAPAKRLNWEAESDRLFAAIEQAVLSADEAASRDAAQ